MVRWDVTTNTHAVLTGKLLSTGLQSFRVWAWGLFHQNTHNHHDHQSSGKALSDKGRIPLFYRLEPPRTQTFYTRGSLTLGKVIGQGDTYPGTLYLYLTTVVCRPASAEAPSGEAWRPSKEEQYRTRGSAP
jgi:hypothetical protein